MALNRGGEGRKTAPNRKVLHRFFPLGDINGQVLVLFSERSNCQKGRTVQHTAILNCPSGNPDRFCGARVLHFALACVRDVQRFLELLVNCTESGIRK